MIDDLEENSAEYHLLQESLRKYYQDNINDPSLHISQSDISGLAMLAVLGGSMLGTGIPVAIKSLWKTGTPLKFVFQFMSGIILTMSGAKILHFSHDQHEELIKKGGAADKEKDKLIQNHADYQTALAVLPHYLDITYGLTSTKPNRHREVVAQTSVYWISFALGQAINQSLKQRVVQSVCFMNNSKQEVCKSLINL